MLGEKTNILRPKSHPTHGGGGYIRCAKNIRITGIFSAFLLVLLTLLSIFPISYHQEQAEATPIISDTQIVMTTGQDSANVDVTPISGEGTFATTTSADAASFSVTTNNFTGYTLSLLGNDATGELANITTSDTLSPITDATDAATFTTGAASTYTNKWGILPSKVNSASNANYLPAPIETGDFNTSREILMDTTTTANTTANNYTIGLGARVDYTKPSGTYTNTFTIVAIGNPATYTISYSKGSVSDTVSDMPTGPTSGSTDAATIPLDSATPTRTGYDFAGWCLGTLSGSTQNPGTTCTGTLITNKTFDINQTTSNINTLYATWTPKKYTCTKQYRLQPANGTFPTTYSSAGTEQVAYNNTCSYTYSGSDKADYKPSASGTNGAAVSGSCTVTTSGCTISLSLYRNTYALTVSKGSNVSSVSGGGTYRWGQGVSISATPSSTYIFSKWNISGTSGTLASATSASTTYTMPKGASTVTATVTPTTFAIAYGSTTKDMQHMTSTICSKVTNGQTDTLKDVRDNQSYTVAKLAGTCWMTKNLAIGCSGSSFSSKSLTSTYSNVSSSFTTPTTSLASGGNSYTEPYMTCNSTYGAWYNYAAASAKTIAANSTTGAQTYDICPKGWHLPSYAQGETIAGTSYVSLFNPTLGGSYISNAIESGDSKYGHYWTSSAYDGTFRYRLSTNNRTDLYTAAYSRYRGLFVRCVAI